MQRIVVIAAVAAASTAYAAGANAETTVPTYCGAIYAWLADAACTYERGAGCTTANPVSVPSSSREAVNLSCRGRVNALGFSIQTQMLSSASVTALLYSGSREVGSDFWLPPRVDPADPFQFSPYEDRILTPKGLFDTLYVFVSQRDAQNMPFNVRDIVFGMATIPVSAVPEPSAHARLFLGLGVSG